MRTPSLARAIVEWLVDPRLRDAVVGDLAEIFASEKGAHPIRARLGYWKRAIGLVLRLGPPWSPRRVGPKPQGDGVMSLIGQDVLHGARLFVKQPGYALAAVVTLALAIGANTLIFTMANVLVLKPLPIREPERLAWIFATGPDVISWRGPISLPEYVTYRDGAPAYSTLSAYQRRTFAMNADGTAERVLGQVVIGDLHALWGLTAIRGRTLTIADERPGAPGVAVLSHRFWSTRFGGSMDIIGRDIRLDGQHRTLVGVLTPDIELGNISEIDVWLPYQGDAAQASRTDRSWRGVGRLAGGATIDSAHTQVTALAARMASEHSDTDRDRSARVGPTKDALGTPNTWIVLSMLVTVVGLLLVIACANVMNLLIARLIARRQELAMRTALGGSRGRIVTQIVSESLVLGLAGGALGLAVAWGGLVAVRTVAYEAFFRQLAFDVRVVGFAAALAFVAPLVFSIVPTLRMLRADPATALNDATMRSIGSRSTARGQSALVVLQVTLGVTLLAVAALIVQSMQTMTRIDTGYAVSSLLSTHIEIPTWKIADDREAFRIRQALVQRATEIPGVEGATTATELPALQLLETVTFAIENRVSDDRAGRPSAGITVASPAYFAVMGIPIVAGRGFADGDAASPAPVVVVSRAMAQRYWGDDGRALGAQIVLDPSAGRHVASTVVGVSADIANAGLGQAPRPQLYVLDAHRPARSFHLIVRAKSPETLAPGLRAAVRDVDADLPTYQLRTVGEAFADETSSNWLLSGLFAAFAIVAMLLATGGLYGVMSYAVSQRTSEIAIRMALGASARDVASKVIARSLALAGIGAALGLAGAFGLAQAMRSVLYGVGPADPGTYLGVLAVTGGAALVASWIPMRRAARVDPIRGLRQT
jgi:putative ABC transport system permease protein